MSRVRGPFQREIKGGGLSGRKGWGNLSRGESDGGYWEKRGSRSILGRKKREENHEDISGKPLTLTKHSSIPTGSARREGEETRK